MVRRLVAWTGVALAMVVVASFSLGLGYHLGTQVQEDTFMIVGSRNEIVTASPVVAETPDGAKININTASVDELQELPGVGPVLAQRIVEFRETYGDFISAEDLLNVSGIGDALLGAIRDLITW